MTNLEYLQLLKNDQLLLSENIKVYAATFESRDSDAYRDAVSRYHEMSQEYSSLFIKVASGELDGNAAYVSA